MNAVAISILRSYSHEIWLIFQSGRRMMARLKSFFGVIFAWSVQYSKFKYFVRNINIINPPYQLASTGLNPKLICFMCIKQTRIPYFVIIVKGIDHSILQYLMVSFSHIFSLSWECRLFRFKVHIENREA